MRDRISFHEILVEALGSRNVYFNPPETLKLKYPCIVYSAPADNVKRADNQIYNRMMQYNVTVIDKDPDSEISSRVAELDYCKFTRSFVSANMYHFAYRIYY